MIYTIDQIKELVAPIAIKYKLKALWVFGSYGRNEATEDSDIDLLMDGTGSSINSFYDLMDITDEFEEILNKTIDLMDIESLFSPMMKKYFSYCMNLVSNERVMLYEKS
jgi:predicted nucleotidyltransferase